MGHVIAIDGPAGAGKSTIARSIAARLGYTYIDSGAMYRAVALWAIRQSIALEDAGGLEQLAQRARIELLPERRVLLNGEDVSLAIRQPEIASAASTIASLEGVRAALVARQREMAGTADVVMEGRDIGTVVFPRAEVKIFLDADPGERIRRRAGEQPEMTEAALAAQIRERDHRDRERVSSPLVQAEDAVYLDSTGLTQQAVEERILDIARPRITAQSFAVGKETT